MKKMISMFLMFCLCCGLVSSVPIHASDDIVYVGGGYIQEIETHNIDTKRWKVVDSDKEYDLLINYKERYIQIDGEITPYLVEVIELPTTRATINYSSARSYQYKVPWKGSAILLGTAIGGLIGGINGASVGSTLASALTADAENVWMTFTQYESVESYYSNYNGIYYHKCINQNIIFYKTSISSANKIYGPIQGTWFDPIRP